MILGASDLIRVHGFSATSFKDVWEHTQTPRGSVYFHFPGGKEELGVEVATMVGADMVRNVNRQAAKSKTPEELVAGVVDHMADQLVATDYVDGCSLAPMVLEMSRDSDALREAADRAFHDWQATLGARMADKGLAPDRAAAIAGLTVSALEGALVLSRASRSREPMQNVTREITVLIQAESTGERGRPGATPSKSGRAATRSDGAAARGRPAAA
jgi:TetR/AcrR family transcriptional regulator, lmrAB and yxaGH operons repressor